MNILGIEPEASGLARLRGGALLFAILIAAFSSPLAARANVYASNVRVNGGTTNVALAAGGTVTVSYTLNEPATLGVAIDFKIGASTVRSIIVTNGGPGALQGTNSVVWDGKDGGGSPVGGGTYTVNVTPAASGYTNWAQISSDSRTNNQITAPRGVSVNNNINSPFFGRVFVGNANQAGASDKVGILKWNADGSPATEGAFSDGGYDWAHGFLPDNYSPYKIETGPDDRLYVSDFSGNGLIFSFDQTISSNSLKSVLRADNYPDFQVQFDGFAVSGSAGAIQLWVADERGGGTGIRHWNLTAGGTNAPGDTGTTVIQPADGLPLDGLPADVALDKNNNIYAIQLAYTGGGGESTNRLLSFAPYGGFPETNANWSFSTNGDAYTGAYGVAVDPSASYVAVGFAGDFGVNGDGGNGVLAVFAASNGAPVSFPFATNNIQHQYLDVAWDNAGNLYALVQE
ncbi:MAG TPA: hypothetical protein VLT36_17725, partial [Candidatus Dormibacteraeota bacterium]|nr:hypothetical protein [Candidatus Dormibacteraeota bacterium]